MTKNFVAGMIVFFLSMLGNIAHASLINNGGGLIYDTDLDITWYDAPDVGKNWRDSMSWAANLTVGGVTGWRLPLVDNCNGWNCTNSEMGHLYFTELGNKGKYDADGNIQPGYGLVNKGPFVNLDESAHWTSSAAPHYSESDPTSHWAYMFFFLEGYQGGGCDVALISCVCSSRR